MNSIDKQVRQLSRLEKTLRGIRIMVVTRKDGTIKVKFGKKFDMFSVPSREWGSIFKDEFEAVINKKADMVKEVITHIDSRMHQMQLDLFGGENGGSKRCIRTGGEQLENTVESGGTGTECKENDSAGKFGGAGEQLDAGGAATGS